MAIYADQQGVESDLQIISSDASGAEFDQTGVLIPVLIPDAEIADLIASYDPAASASPSASDSRVIARVLLDALRSEQGL